MNNIEGIEFFDINDAPKTEDKKGFKAIGLSAKGETKVFPFDNLMTTDEVDKRLLDFDANYKDIYATVADLESAYPSSSNKKGWFAFVGTEDPVTKYKVLENGGSWIKTDETFNMLSADLSGLYKKVDDALTAQETTINETLNNKVAEIDEKLEEFETGLGEYAKTTTEDGTVVRSKDGKVDFGSVLEVIEELKNTDNRLDASLEANAIELSNINSKLDDTLSSIDYKFDNFYIEEEDGVNKIYFTSNGEVVAEGELPLGGGGGGGGVATGVVCKLKAVNGTSLVVGEKDQATISWEFTSIDTTDGSETGDGQILISVNNIPIYSGTVQQGISSHDVTSYVNLGRNSIKVKVTDSYGTSRTLNFNIQKASLTLTSYFNEAKIYDTDAVDYKYTVIGSGNKTITFNLNGTDLESMASSASGIQLTKKISGLIAGVNKLIVKATSIVDGALLQSNELYSEIAYAKEGMNTYLLTSSFNQTTAKQFSTIQIPFFAYNPYGDTALVQFKVDGVEVDRMQVNRTQQYWNYKVVQSDNIKIELVCGNAIKTFNLEILESALGITEVLSDLAFKTRAVGKSNSSSNKASWDYGNYKTTFNNFNWDSDGWLKDVSGLNALVLSGDASIDCNIKPFSTTVMKEGLTLTIEYSTKGVLDDDAVIIEQMINGVGFQITPTSVLMSGSGASIEAKADSSDRISVTFVIQKQGKDNLLELYIDGILSGAIVFQNTDSFYQSAVKNLVASTAGRQAVVYIYGIRWYKNDLEDKQILNNYTYDTEDSTLQDKIFKRNQILDDYGNIDYELASSYIPIMTIVGTLPQSKKEKLIADIYYYNKQDPSKSFTAKDVKITVQGTSSQFYVRKNYKITFANGLTYDSTGEQADAVTLHENVLPAEVICMKADYAEASGTHNTGFAVMADEILKGSNILIPEQKVNSKIRTTVYGYPILICHRQTISDAPVFIGKYNMNTDKSAINTFGFEEGVHESWEFLDNTSDICLFKGGDWTSTFVNDDGETVPEWTNHLEGRFPDGSLDISNVKKVFDWVVSCKDNPTKFRSEFEQYFDLQNMLAYWVLSEVFLCVDQRAKNQFLTRYSDGKWRMIFYDNDTILGIDNVGKIKFNWNIESTDKVGDGYAFNGWDSQLWLLFRQAFWTEIVQMYRTLRNGKLNYSFIYDSFQTKQADKWAEIVYNKDGYFKYIEPKLPEYYSNVQGSRSYHRIWFIKNRLAYMDSMFNTGDYANDFVSMRLYTPTSYNIQPNHDFRVQVNKDSYIYIRYGQTNTISQRTKKGDYVNFTAPSNMTFNDTETAIYGASCLKDLGDLSTKYLGLVDVSRAVMLERLIIGSTTTGYSNSNFKTLSVGTNTLLKEINVANCIALTGSLDFSELISLETFNASNTNLKSVTLPKSGLIKTLTLPTSITDLRLTNQTSLTTLKLEGYTNIQTLVVENSTQDGYQLCKNIYASGNRVLSNVRLIDVSINDSNDNILAYLLSKNGIAEDGSILINSPVITGTAYFGTITQFNLDLATSMLPDLKISYGQKVDKLTFASSEIESLALETYDTSGKGYLLSNEIEGKVWTPSLQNLVQEGQTFHELMYFMGGTATVGNTAKLKSIGIGTNATRRNATLTNMLNLVSVLINDMGESIYSSPKLDTATFGNCNNIENFDIYGTNGRYSVSKDMNALLAKYGFMSSMFVEYFIHPIKPKIVGRFILNTISGYPLVVNIPNDVNYLNGSKNWTFNNIHTFSAPISFGVEDIVINGVGRNYAHSFSSERYTSFLMENTVSTDHGLGNIIINANTDADAPLHKVSITPYHYTSQNSISLLKIDAKITPDSIVSTCNINTLNKTNAAPANCIGKVIFGANYMPKVFSTRHNIGMYHQVNEMIIQASTYNGQPYVQMITGPNPAIYSGTLKYTIGTLYVPDERIDDYKAQYPIIGGTAGTNCVIGALRPLSEYVGEL